MTQDRNALLPSWVASYAPTKQIYVSPDGSDFNSGVSPVAPVQTTAAAFAKAGPGVKINFAAGTYGCNVSLSDINGGKDAPVMIYSANGAGQAKFDCNQGPSFLIDGVHGLIVEGVEIYNANDHGFHIQTSNPATDGSNLSSDIVIHNSIIHDVALAAVKNSQSIGFYAIGDTFYNTPNGEMVESVAASRVTLSNNEGYNGLAFDEIKGGALGGEVYRNCVHDAQNGIFVGGDETGTQFLINPAVRYEARNLRVWDNVIVNTPSSVFRIVGCHDCTIANNSAWTSAPDHVLRIQPDVFANPDGSTIPIYNGNLTIVNNLFGADVNSAYMITCDDYDQGVGSQGFNFVMTHNAWWWGPGAAPWADMDYLSDATSLYWMNPRVVAHPSDLVPTASSPLPGNGMPVSFVTANANGTAFRNPLNIAGAGPNIGAF